MQAYEKNFGNNGDLLLREQLNKRTSEPANGRTPKANGANLLLLRSERNICKSAVYYSSNCGSCGVAQTPQPGWKFSLFFSW